jgi:hypothetical protein
LLGCLTDRGLRVYHLALKVRNIDHVIIHNPYSPNTRCCKVQQEG